MLQIRGVVDEHATAKIVKSERQVRDNEHDHDQRDQVQTHVGHVGGDLPGRPRSVGVSALFEAESAPHRGDEMKFVEHCVGARVQLLIIGKNVVDDGGARK